MRRITNKRPLRFASRKFSRMLFPFKSKRLPQNIKRDFSGWTYVKPEQAGKKTLKDSKGRHLHLLSKQVRIRDHHHPQGVTIPLRIGILFERKRKTLQADPFIVSHFPKGEKIIQIHLQQTAELQKKAYSKEQGSIREAACELAKELGLRDAESLRLKPLDT